VWNAPLLHDGALYVAGRDRKLYSFDARSGALRWAAETGGPILASPALDVSRAQVYVASEDLRVYAFDAASGAPRWCSQKLPGVSFRGYHPVIAPDSSVLVTTTPSLPLDAFEKLLLDMAREVFGDFASWRHSKEENARLRCENFRLLDDPQTYAKQLAYPRRRLSEERTYGWHDSLLLVHDEQCQLTVAGNVLLNAHQDNVNGLSLETREGYREPFCRNIHEPKPGEALGIWSQLLRGEELPVGKEWLGRGTAVYGGGSAIDAAVAVAGETSTTCRRTRSTPAARSPPTAWRPRAPRPASTRRRGPR
jgi:hypothetical protein